MSDSKWTYFQYQKEENLPVFIKVDLSAFDAALAPFLTQMRFEALKEVEAAELERSLELNFTGNVLTMSIAGPNVSKQISQVTESDRYGAECITPKQGYRVYRHKAKALLVYSFGVGFWEMGCHKDFGSEVDQKECRTIINRYLSWALVSQGIVGFWGVPVEEGIVVLRKKEAEGEAVFIDVRKEKIYSIDGARKLKQKFTILRLDSVLKGKNIKMTSEELLSFLTVNSTFFDYQGLTVPVRQAIKSLAKISEGLVHPRESFRPRTDLSL